MAQATVKTVQYIDPRIEPQPDPVYDYVIGPTQNQYYKIPASGKSNSNITFNNLTTLGVDRAYLDTFEIEINATIRFYQNVSYINPRDTDPEYEPYTTKSAAAIAANKFPCPRLADWTFQSFPFNTCCDQARVNINGGAFFSEPMCYVRAKERYMNQRELSRCYENVCPIHRPVCQTESARTYNDQITATAAQEINNIEDQGYPTRYGRGIKSYLQSQEGLDGGFNNSIVKINAFTWGVDPNNNQAYMDCNVTWREPLFVSPFSSRYDATYGRPLYNITSLDFAFNLMDLGNMIRLAPYIATPMENEEPDEAESITPNMFHLQNLYVSSYTVNINTAALCYQVMTIPAMLQKPLTTLVPYRRFVPYITNYNSSSGTGGTDQVISRDGAENIEIRSGVYTLNEIPTAIWVFCAPTKDVYQTNKPDMYTDTPGRFSLAEDEFNISAMAPAWDTNKLFGFLRKVNISLANTTQILYTASPYDLYRIAKANGCEDSYLSWGGLNTISPCIFNDDVEADNFDSYNKQEEKYMIGAGSVLRLRPGVDIIVPDMPLIPGANANNMVLQVTANFDVPPHSANQNTYALWLLFEYVGVAAISPGQCEITMNPLGSGEVVAASPVMSATSTASEGVLEGSGFWDCARRCTGINRHIGDSSTIARLLKRLPPGMRRAADWIEERVGPSAKKPKEGGEGGAVIGRGLGAWV